MKRAFKLLGILGALALILTAATGGQTVQAEDSTSTCPAQDPYCHKINLPIVLNSFPWAPQLGCGPLFGIMQGSRLVECGWSTRDYPNNNYLLEQATRPDFSDTTVIPNNCCYNFFYFEVPSMGTYYFRVKEVRPDGSESPWSNTATYRAFTEQISGFVFNGSTAGGALHIDGPTQSHWAQVWIGTSSADSPITHVPSGWTAVGENTWTKVFAPNEAISFDITWVRNRANGDYLWVSAAWFASQSDAGTIGVPAGFWEDTFPGIPWWYCMGSTVSAETAKNELTAMQQRLDWPRLLELSDPLWQRISGGEH